MEVPGTFASGGSAAALDIRTHQGIDHRLCGKPVAVALGEAAVELVTLAEMAVDSSGLVHGGFIFGLADHAAMLAVNDPHVVLGSAEARFEGPVGVGERLVARARLSGEPGAQAGRKRIVEVTVHRAKEGGQPVLSGRFVCLVLERHVLAHRAGASGRERRDQKAER